MTLDEAKAMIESMRDSTVFPFTNKAVQALGIALWLMEREMMVRGQLNDGQPVALTVDGIDKWHKANPVPYDR